MADKKRLLWIDVAKGICMIAVIAGHMGETTLNRIVFAFHLTVYFILSGYTLKNDISREGLNKKFKRLMTPYFITCFAVTVMDILNLIIVSKTTSVVSITKKIGYDLLRSFMASGAKTNFGTVTIDGRIGAIWFLPALFFAIVMVQILLRYIKSKKMQWAIAFLAAVLSSISASFIWLPFSIQSGLFAAPFVLLGYELKQYNIIEKINIKHAIVSLIIFLLGFFANKTMVAFVSASMPDLLISTICALASSICILFISKKLEKCKPLVWVGQNSIYFLCIHLFELETMYSWYKKLFNISHIPYNFLTLLCVKLIFITAVTYVILLIKRIPIPKKALPIAPTNRDRALDVAKAVLITLMLVGNFTVDERFRSIVYSFHMMAFVFYSGFCFKPAAAQNLKKSVWNLIKSFLLPYAIFSVFYILLHKNGFLQEIITLLCGVSFTEKILTGIPSIGLMCFVLLLFAVRLIYLLIERLVPGTLAKNIVVLGITLLGVLLGELGYWLPWSLDCAMYSLIFYHLGYYFKKYRIMDFLLDRLYVYFILSSVWVYMIYSGSMEIAIRKYGKLGITVMGAVCASVLLYMISRYIGKILPNAINRVLLLVGQNTLYILMVHTLIGEYIGKLVNRLSLTSGYIYHFTLSVLLQIIIGVIIGIIISVVQRLLQPHKTAR